MMMAMPAFMVAHQQATAWCLAVDAWSPPLLLHAEDGRRQPWATTLYWGWIEQGGNPRIATASSACEIDIGLTFVPENWGGRCATAAGYRGRIDLHRRRIGRPRDRQ